MIVDSNIFIKKDGTIYKMIGVTCEKFKKSLFNIYTFQAVAHWDTENYMLKTSKIVTHKLFYCDILKHDLRQTIEAEGYQLLGIGYSPLYAIDDEENIVKL